jgi:hypothetical protein
MKTEEQKVIDELYERENRSGWTYPDTSIKQSVNLEHYPDAKKHQIVSFIKSAIRILGYILIPFDLFWSAGILILSEIIGIIEELV